MDKSRTEANPKEEKEMKKKADTMNIQTFRSKVMSQWIGGWTSRKFINQARKHGLVLRTQEDINNLHYLVGNIVSQAQQNEFQIQHKKVSK